MHYELKNGSYLISTNPRLIDVDFTHHFLTRSYWAEGISKEIIERKIKNALCFGVYLGREQVGFARVISDYVSFAYLADVFIIEAHRGKKLSKWLMRAILSHPDLQDLRSWVLRTRDAHTLYQQFGFTALKHPERFMEITVPHIYLEKNHVANES